MLQLALTDWHSKSLLHQSAEARPHAKAIKYKSLLELNLDSVLITSSLPKRHDQGNLESI